MSSDRLIHMGREDSTNDLTKEITNGGIREMNELRKPAKLNKGDTIATVSPCNGWAGDQDIRWKYELGVSRLNDLGLNVIPAPNSMKGSSYLSENPRARAEDIMWAFENKDVKAIIANVGGNDSIRVIPYIDASSIADNPKIFMGFSDVMNLHILCYRCGLSSFYGDNLLSPIAEQQGWHEYSKNWFQKALFQNSQIGLIEPSADWTYEQANYTDRSYVRPYYPNPGYELIQGHGVVQGRLFGGHTGLAELENTPVALSAEDFRDTILFLEDIPEFFTPQAIIDFLKWLHRLGALRLINGIILGRANENTTFSEHKKTIKEFMSDLSLYDLPILYGINFGHSSPICVLPYGAKAEINCVTKSFSILESGVL